MLIVLSAYRLGHPDLFGGPAGRYGPTTIADDDQPTHLLVYEYVPDMLERRGPHRTAHLERIAAEREAGRISTAGAFDPPTGAAIVFTGVSRNYVEEFVAADPYQRGGLVAAWRVERWKLV